MFTPKKNIYIFYLFVEKLIFFCLKLTINLKISVSSTPMAIRFFSSFLRLTFKTNNRGYDKRIDDTHGEHAQHTVMVIYSQTTRL